MLVTALLHSFNSILPTNPDFKTVQSDYPNIPVVLDFVLFTDYSRYVLNHWAKLNHIQSHRVRSRIYIKSIIKIRIINEIRVFIVIEIGDTKIKMPP